MEGVGSSSDVFLYRDINILLLLLYRATCSSMARGRSKSIVQKVASEVPAYSQSTDNDSSDTKSIHNPTLPQSHPQYVLMPQRGRSKSLTVGVDVKVEVAPETPTFPFSEEEKDALWMKTLDTLNYNTVLDSQHIDSVNNYNDDLVLQFQSDCNLNISQIDSIVDENQFVISSLNTLMFQYDKVSKETSEFANQATGLLQKQEELEAKAQQMDHVLQIFEPLERISKKLVSSGNSVVRTGRITTMLIQLQECLEFLATHENYKDSEVYIIRYRQCMTRGLTLVRNYLIDYIKKRGEEAYAKTQGENLKSLSWDIILYSEYISELNKEPEASSFSTLVGQIVRQSASHSEYKGLVSDVLSQYFKSRIQLVHQHVAHNRTVDDSENLVLHSQKSISWYKKILEKEYNLFVKYFPIDEWDTSLQSFITEELNSFYKDLLDPLYDEVRKRVLREQNIGELCKLTNLLTAYFEFDEETSVVSTLPDAKIEYGELFEPMLGISQSRLIFRIQNYIDNKLIKYKPKAEDLRLGRRRSSSRQRSRADSILNEVEDNLFPDAYTPVGKALTILSNIYDLISSMVFDDMAHYIVHSCISMLKNGALPLAKSHLGSLDAKLFYFKNLMVLRTQLNNFDTQYVRAETSLDFTSGITELIKTIRSGELQVKVNEQGGLLELVRKSAPQVINNLIDANEEAESELSNTVTDWVAECANTICSPLTNECLSLKDKLVTFNDNVIMQFPKTHNQIKAYIEDNEVIRFLVDQVSKFIFTSYESFYVELEQKLGKGELQADDMSDVMEPDAFFNFLNDTVTGIFQAEEAELAVKLNENILEDLEKMDETISQN